MWHDAWRISGSLFQVAPDSSATTSECPRSTSSGGSESSLNFARLPTEPLGDEWQCNPMRRPPRRRVRLSQAGSEARARVIRVSPLAVPARGSETGSGTYINTRTRPPVSLAFDWLAREHGTHPATDR